MAGAAAGLRHQSDQLVRVVSVFRLPGGSGAPLQTSARAASAAQTTSDAIRRAPALAPSAAAAKPAAPAAPAKTAAAKPVAMASTADDDWDSF